MSYTTIIKDEIALTNKEYSKPELIAELSGFIRNNATIKNKKVYLTTENINITRRISNFLNILFNITTEVTTIENLNFSKKEQ